MSTLAGGFFALLFYLATLVFSAGLLFKLFDYARTPAPLKIPTTPAPTTRAGVTGRMVREVVLFESLFRGNLWIWAFGWVFHVGLALVVVRHLRYFVEPVWSWVQALQVFGIYAAFLMMAGLAGLLVRRFAVERIRYISTRSDYLMLVLLLAIGASGLMMKWLTHVDVVGVKAFFLGLLALRIEPLPVSAPLFLHLLLVAALMIIFPFSKLLHAPGVFFSPSRNQVDNPRETRHIAGWAARLEKGSR